MTTCGLCGLANPDGASACQRCSASLVATPPGWGAYGGYQPSPLGFPPQPYAPMGSYGAPLPGLATAGLWQQGGVLVMEKGAQLPDRCVKCNAPANGRRLIRNLTWHPGAVYLLLLVSLLVYIIVAMLVRKSAVVDVGICEEHRAKRRTAIIIGWSLGLLGLFGVFGAIAMEEGILALVGLVSSLVGIIWGAIGARVVHPSRIDDHYVWLKGVHPAFLGQLPPGGG